MDEITKELANIYCAVLLLQKNEANQRMHTTHIKQYYRLLKIKKGIHEMAEYAIYFKDDDGVLEVHCQIEKGIHNPNSKAARAAEFAKNAIKQWIDEGGDEWENIKDTSITSSKKNPASKRST